MTNCKSFEVNAIKKNIFHRDTSCHSMPQLLKILRTKYKFVTKYL